MFVYSFVSGPGGQVWGGPLSTEGSIVGGEKMFTTWFSQGPPFVGTIMQVSGIVSGAANGTLTTMPFPVRTVRVVTTNVVDELET